MKWRRDLVIWSIVCLIMGAAIGRVVMGLLEHPAVAATVCTPLGTLTTNLSLCKPAAGEVNWNTAINNNFDILDSTIGGGAGSFTQGSIPFADSTHVLTQDNANLYWQATDKRLIIGTNLAGAGYGDGSLTVDLSFGANTVYMETAASNNSGVGITTATPNAGLLTFQTSKGTYTAKTAVTTNDVIGGIISSGWDGTAFSNSSAIRNVINNTIATGIVPGRLEFLTTRPAIAAPSVKVIVDATGALAVSDTVAATSLGGSLYFKGMNFSQMNGSSATNGTLTFCTDCTIASPCAAGGTGALAKRLNNTWVCN